MLKIDNVQVYGFEPAIRGMRNPLDSWNKSDSYEYVGHHKNEFIVGKNDLGLMNRLCKAGVEHRKYLRMIPVWMDIEGNHFFWAEFDTYKIGTTRNSCSKMHRIHVHSFITDDRFDHEGIDAVGGEVYEHFCKTRQVLEYLRVKFNATHERKYWRALLELLPMGYRLKATVMINYEVALNIIKQRTGHKVEEWHTLVDVLENLPYMAEIRGIDNEQSTEESTKH